MKSLVNSYLTGKGMTEDGLSGRDMRVYSLITDVIPPTYDLYVYYAGITESNGGYTQSETVNGKPSYVNGNYTIWYDTYPAWALSANADVGNLALAKYYRVDILHESVIGDWTFADAPVGGNPTTSASPIVGETYYIISNCDYEDSIINGLYKPSGTVNGKPSWSDYFYTIFWSITYGNTWAIAASPEDSATPVFVSPDLAIWTPYEGVVATTIDVNDGVTY